MRCRYANRLFAVNRNELYERLGERQPNIAYLQCNIDLDWFEKWNTTE